MLVFLFVEIGKELNKKHVEKNDTYHHKILFQQGQDFYNDCQYQKYIHQLSIMRIHVVVRFAKLLLPCQTMCVRYRSILTPRCILRVGLWKVVCVWNEMYIYICVSKFKVLESNPPPGPDRNMSPCFFGLDGYN